MLKGKSIEEIINRWSTDLESHVREFNKFATEVAVWDRALIENGNNVGLPCPDVPRYSFDMILSCSSRLCMAMFWLPNESKMISTSRWNTSNNRKGSSPLQLKCTRSKCRISSVVRVEPYGRWIPALPTPSETKSRFFAFVKESYMADPFSHSYMLATELHNHLDDLSSSLTQLIDSVNAMSIGQGDSKVVSADDPMTQIAQVLSNHLESLQWIDGASRELDEKVVEVEKRIKDVGGVSQGTPSLGSGSRSRGFGLNR